MLHLAWLFQANFRDGTFIQQTPEDVSALDPGRSAFYDVLQRTDELVSFGLFQPDSPYTVAVDITTGHFEINGFPIMPQPVSGPVIPAGGRFELLYFRDHQQDLVQTVTIGEDGEPVEVKREKGEHRISYRLGWKYTHGTREWVQTIVVV